MSAIVVDDLVKRFGTHTAVENVSFDVPSGQVTALLGPNGAGKTTTIEILEGFQAPTSGAVRVLGTNPWRAGRRHRARVGLVMQSTSLDSQLTVAETLKLYNGLYSGRRYAEEVLDLIDLASDARTRIGALSGGQRRRVDLGIAIIGRPEVLFLDEPTTGLDPEARRHLWAVIGNLTANGTTVLLTTHYLDEAQHLAAKVVVLAHGQVIANTTPDELRAMGGGPVIRFRVPPGAPDLPVKLAEHLRPDVNELVMPSADVTSDLETLVAWARASHVDLTSLEVGPPSLEDAYLVLTASGSEAATVAETNEALTHD